MNANQISSLRRASRRVSVFALCLFSGVAWANRCGDPATPIATIQGTGTSSPLAGQTVTVEAVLTQDSRHPGGFQGFYLQQSDQEADDNPRTSEALFVYTRRTLGQPGDRLRVTGRVKEFHGLTELVGVKSLIRCGREPLPRAISLTLPWSDSPEALENMRVQFRGPLTVISNYQLANYGELTLAQSDQVIATEHLAPGPEAEQTAQNQRWHRLVLDDGRKQRQPRPIPWPPGGLSGDSTIRAGDRLSDLRGVLDFRFGDWRLQPAEPPTWQPANPRQPPPPRPAEPHLRVMALNLANYFNGDGQGRGWPSPRGARSQAAFEVQHQRLRTALLAPDPDVLALSEIENDGYGENSSVATLARALGPNWRVVASPGADGGDDIRTVLLYRADRVQPLGAPERLNQGLFRHQGRPPVSQVFRAPGAERGIRIVALHLKSKSCRGASGADADQHDGQGCYSNRRVRAAQAIADWLAAMPANSAPAGTLVTGDLNAYAQEAPLQVFRNAGFTSMVHQFHPCDATGCRHYSYRYQGAKGSLDYALASETLRPNILNASTWLLNSDEPRALAYDGAAGPLPNLPWRVSDHNPVITDIRL